MPPLPIAIVANPAARFGRELVRGICAWAGPRGCWEPRLVAPGWCADPDPAVRGVIGYLPQRWSGGVDVPVVDLTVRADPPAWLPRLDEVAVGTLAAHHLQERHFRHLAVITSPDLRMVGLARQSGFLAAAGPLAQAAPPEVAGTDDDLERWLADLPRPCGLFAANDLLAERCAMLLRRRGVTIPEEVAVLGADDDDLRCALAWPPLSSVRMPHRQLGAAAADALAILLTGEVPPPAVPIPPTTVAIRASTATEAVDDPLLARAIGVIRARVGDPVFGIPALAATCGCHRRRLERHFREQLGRSPLDELQRARLARARTLLADTDLDLPAVAAAVGLSPSALNAAFRRDTGATPGAWRAAVRNHQDGPPVQGGTL